MLAAPLNNSIVQEEFIQSANTAMAKQLLIVTINANQDSTAQEQIKKKKKKKSQHP